MAVALSIQARQQYSISLIWKVPLSWLVAYSQIYFARNRVSGALFMAATFVVPSHGASGLLGLAATEFWAWLLGRPVAHRRDGYYGFNGLLVGLALGLYYTFTPSLIGLLLVATLLTVMVASARTATGSTRPSSPSTPEGISRLSTAQGPSPRAVKRAT